MIALPYAGTVAGAQSALEKVPLFGVEPPAVPFDEFRYGRERGQVIVYTPPAGNSSAAPLAVLLRESDVEYSTGFLRPRLRKEGFGFATIRYDPENNQERSADIRNVAAAIALLRKQAERRRIDPNRIVLIATGTAAQLALLLATDPAWLEEAGVPLDAIRGVVTVNGTGFDITESLARVPPHLRTPYYRLFGMDPLAHARLSPSAHLTPPNAGRFLFLFERHEERMRREAEGGAGRFAAAGLSARAGYLAKWHPETRSTYLLAEAGGAGDELLAFLNDAAGVGLGSASTSP